MGHRSGNTSGDREAVSQSGEAGQPARGKTRPQVICGVCAQTFPLDQTVPLAELRPALAAFARESHPDLGAEGLVCLKDLARLRAAFVARLLERERGELGALEIEVVESLAANETLAEDVEKSFERERTFGDRMADALAMFGGSWGFIGVFAAILVVWIVFNLITVGRAQFDPYPFILLNLVLSCLAAIQAPVIMMSQKRVEVRDRMRAENDFKVNLKAELEIRHLHEKLDHLLGQQWERLAQIQEIQLDVLEAMNGRRK
ncbi:DUF1003 domain-containing protein [Xanthobacter agilis]|uniref:Membrane protein n=1 Tax=Xanthobacter agilis TaxID=47492 RepID=A0ABU0LDS8_XANAG|nr:DUF1003 domain-containing protein [Xanthobacter agilis]MDQ0505302.1 putative membrane protein [Xanthobacter agilis]